MCRCVRVYEGSGGGGRAVYNGVGGLVVGWRD